MLTDDEITEIFESMPNGIDGWLKAWGYKQFAQAIEQRILAKVAIIALDLAIKIQFSPTNTSTEISICERLMELVGPMEIGDRS